MSSDPIRANAAIDPPLDVLQLQERRIAELEFDRSRTTEVLRDLSDTIKSLQQALFGNNDSTGQMGRLKMLEYQVAELKAQLGWAIKGLFAIGLAMIPLIWSFAANHLR